MAGTTFRSHFPSEVNLRLLVVKSSKLPDICTVFYFLSVYVHFLSLSFVFFSNYRWNFDASCFLIMAGNLTSPFQGLNPVLPPRVATTLSREQFLYSLARTPSPARFQRPRSNAQILSGPNIPFQTREIRDRAIDYPHDAPGAYGFNPIEGPNSEPPGKGPVAQINQNVNGVNNRRNLIPNEAATNIQRLAPGTKSRSTLRATQIPAPISERRTGKELDKTDAVSVELGECSTSFDLGDEYGYNR